MVRVLFDIVHPAHALFFRQPMRRLAEEGHDLLVASRHKDITIELLEGSAIEHTPISRKRRGRIGLMVELVERDARLLRTALKFRPDVMAGFGGVAISHVGALLRVPSVAFYDSETATTQMRLTLPFVSEWHVPESYDGPTAPGRTHRFAGLKPLAFLHPDHFTPDRERALEAGLDPERDNFFLRLVSWGAAHDLGRNGMAPGFVRDLIGWLSSRGRVHISAEGDLPPELEPLQYTGSPVDVHHLLAHCRLCVGESASMAAEAAVLGVPGFFLAGFRLGYIEELADAGLVEQHRTWAETERALERVLAEPPDLFRSRRDALLEKKINVAEYVVDVIRSAAAP